MRISQRLPMDEITRWGAASLQRRAEAADRCAERQEGLLQPADAALSRKEGAWFRKAMARKAREGGSPQETR